MTKASLIILICILFSCSKKQEKDCIGEETAKGDYSIYENIQDSLKLSWNDILTSDSINSTIRALKIIKDKDIKTQKEYYGILGTTKNDSAKVITSIEFINNKFYFRKNEIFTMAICYGSKKCNPKMYNGKWVCDDGTNKQSCSLGCQKKIISTINH